MKLSKNAMTVLSFTIGACVFISTAFADMALGSGYDRFKGSIKKYRGADGEGIEQLHHRGAVHAEG